MAEISPRGKVLLASVVSNCQNTSSDVDFSDVFGGPPRRTSMTQELSYCERSSVEEIGSRWLKLREKPVFGEVSGVRRRYTSDDFFDDIFRGEQPLSGSQSPRLVPRRSTFASAPGSRVMSPSPSLPPAQPFAAPANFSLPGHLINTEFMPSTSMNQSFFNPSLSRFNQTIQNHDGGIRSSNLPNGLPHQDTDSIDKSSSDSYIEGIAEQSGINIDAEGSEFPIYAANFHFSIYKWASKGVPLVISLKERSPRSKEASKLGGSSRGNEKGVRPDAFSSKENVSPSLAVNELFNNSLASSRTAHAQSVDNGIATPRSNPNSVFHSSNKVDKVHKIKDPPMSLPKEKRSTRPLPLFINNDNEGFGNKTTLPEKAEVEEKEKSSSVNNVSSNKVDKNKVQKSSSATRKKDAHTGKVNDFVKIFNQESPSKASGPRLHKSDCRRRKNTKTVEVDYEIRFSSARMNDDMEASYVVWEQAWPDTLEMEDGNSSGSQLFNVDDIGCVPDPARQTTPSAPNEHSQKDSVTNTDAASKDYETKVSQWSKGKEGNIRALLSTLQFVLWPDSGWKPVPLVDIIEANAVKRAYQKALLRLHPDKLQQNSAAPHHKLIAQKVFDILQEAWDQFNSLGSL